MDRDIWRILLAAVRSADRRTPRAARRALYSDRLILKMYLWTVWHDRPMCWGCDLRNYHGWLRTQRLPSVSQFSRRMRSQRIQQLLHAVGAYLTRVADATGLSFFDGKPLEVRRQSRDRTARVGYADRGFARGYKLHAYAARDGFITAFAVEPMNVSEVSTARRLAPRVPAATLVLADANYDSSPLYGAIAEQGAMLLTPLKGLSENPQHLRRMSAGRQTAMAWWRNWPTVCAELMKLRGTIERIFAALTTAGGGLTTLPPWVRTIGRVRRWVAAKIAIYHARLRLRLRAA